MPTPNPEYDPNWEARYTHHQAAFDRLMEIDIDDREEGSQAQIDHHLSELQSCDSCYKHETIQDMAVWLFEHFDPGKWSMLKNDVITQIDFEKFTSRDEIRAAYVEAHDLVEMLEGEERGGMDVGRPDGLDIFEESDTHKIEIHWQHFSHEELYGTRGSYIDRGVTTMVSVDQREGEYHICFSEPHKIIGNSATNTIENLATAMHRRINENPSQESSQRKGIWENLRSQLVAAITGKAADALRPDQLHFYLHNGPYVSFGERFGPVKMDFHNGVFQNPKFGQYDVMPESIQKAHRESRSRTVEISASNTILLADETDGFDPP